MVDGKQLKEEDQKKEQNLPLSRMFKRENRLVTGVRFGNSHSNTFPQFVLKVKKNGLLLNRFGVVVSKKIDKRAVVRNKIKRIFRNVLSDLSSNMISGHDILFIAKVGSVNKTRAELEPSIKNALEKAEIIK